MRSLLKAVLAGMFAATTLLPLTIAPAYALGTVEDYLACPMSDQIKDKNAAINWWNRRSELEQRLVLSVPCEERFAPLVCIFLYDPDLKGCTENGVAEYRANKFCQEKGLELLSQELSDCKETYKKNHGPATS